MRTCEADVVVIGGGIAGLAATAELSRRGARVALLEARTRFGGRLFTERPAGWSHPVELGAQFVHGGNTPFWRLAREAGLSTKRAPASHWQPVGDRLASVDVYKRIAAVTKRISERRMAGWSFARFLRAQAGALDPRDRALAEEFVQGFQAAPTKEMSAVAMAGETLDSNEQFFVTNGYDRLIYALLGKFDPRRVSLFVDAPCGRIEWRGRDVTVHAPDAVFHGRAAVVALPLGVLQARKPERGALEFSPQLREKERVIAAMGNGQVIKLMMRLDRRRWQAIAPSELRVEGSGFGFVHTTETLPVWWSVRDDGVLTGWAGGPRARELAGLTAAEIEQRATISLARALRLPLERVRAAVLRTALHNWSRDPFSRGAYSFIRAGAEEAAAALREPVDDTLFFAGEVTAEGGETGTVHGAYASGLRAANEVAAALRG